ncbi:MAG: TonB-dependent receptor family protein [Burkholderiales bacterium]
MRIDPRSTAALAQTIAAALCAVLPALPAAAQDKHASDATPPLEQVVVTASRTKQRILDTAASIDVVTPAQIHDGQAEENLSEPLARVPGIFALNRQNYAQDLLISSRGFGANSTFGARGIKIFVDGIPGTAADGQGQISHIDLASTDRIEVMRGPFSVLYGNSAGGVVNVFTENGKPGREVTPYFSAGSYGQRKDGLKFDGDQDGVNYVLDAGSLHTDGSRDHSAADRQNENAKLGFRIGADTSITLVANNVNLKASDPLGLTAAQLRSDARAAGSGALAFDTRKSVDQTQGGVTLTQRISASDSLTLTPYYGNRHTIQYLASGVNGVINLQRAFYGMNSKWLHSAEAGGMPLNLVAGLDSNQNQDHRLTFVNAGGQQVSGKTDQDYSMSARNLDAYLQGELRPNERLALTMGARQSQTTLNTTSNNALPNLGSHTYHATTGVVSAQYYVQSRTNVYLSYGSGFDTPTLSQTIYSPSYVNFGTKNTGNVGLQAARTQQLEIGIKSEISASAQVKAAMFDSATSDDIVIAASNGGKSAYRNAPKTSRKGMELSAQWQLPYQLQASLAYTLVNARVEQAYTETITNASGATSSSTINSGNRIPGVPDQGLFAEMMWRKADRSLEIALEGRAAGSIAANDLNQAYAGGYGIMNLRAIARQHVGALSISEFARIDNVFDRSYVGSVIVNQASSQFYESAPGRNWLAGVKVAVKF